MPRAPGGIRSASGRDEPPDAIPTLGSPGFPGGLLNIAVSQVGGGNGGAEDKASGDDLVAEMSDMHCSTVT